MIAGSLPELMDLDEVAALVQLSPSSLRRIILREGGLTLYRFGQRTFRVRKEEVGRWLEGMALKPVPPSFEGRLFPGRGH